MHVVEGVEAIARRRMPGVGEWLPAIADVDAAQHQAPQHRGGVHHLERDGTLRGTDPRVVQRERTSLLAELEVVEREMPPVVKRQPIVYGPVGDPALEPFDAFADPALHLHHVRHRVHGPRIAAVQVQRPPAGLLGTAIQRGLLEPEGVHAEHVAVARHVGAPVRQDLRDAVAQQGRLAVEEVGDMRGLHRDEVARVLDDDVTVEPQRALEVALEPGARRGGVHAFALVGARAERLDGRDALLQHRHCAALARHDGEGGTQAVRLRRRPGRPPAPR